MSAGLVATLLLGGGIWLMASQQLTWEDVRHLFELTLELLSVRPGLLFLSIVILPGLGVPAGPLLILAGIVYGRLYGLTMACVTSMVALTLNMMWTYWVAAFYGRRFFRRWLRHAGYAIPDSRSPHWQLTLLIRISPGIPLVVQNYLLGLTLVPFKLYLIISILTQSAYTVGFVVSGGAIFGGQAGLAIGGIALLLALILLTRLVHRQHVRRPKPPVSREAERRPRSAPAQGSGESSTN